MKTYIVIMFSFFAIFTMAEVIKRRSNVHAEITRKFVHVACGVVAIYCLYTLTKIEFILLSLAFFATLFITGRKKLLQSLYALKRKTYGDLTYILGLIILSLFLYEQKNLMTLGILLLMLPDALAGLGDHFANRTEKSFTHVAIYFFIALCVSLIELPFSIAILLACTITVTEFYSPYGLDNLSVPAVFTFVVFLVSSNVG